MDSRINQKFNMFTAKEFVGSGHGGKRYIFECECGTRREFAWGRVSSGHYKNCGCVAREKREFFESLIYPGATFGKLTAIALNPTRDGHWDFSCECGNKATYPRHRVLIESGGHKRSCGCIGKKYAAAREKKGISVKSPTFKPKPSKTFEFNHAFLGMPVAPLTGVGRYIYA